MLVALLLFSCGNNDDDVACLSIDPSDSNLFIDLVNAQGENLIANGTYAAEDIIVRFRDFETTNPVVTVEGFENFILVSVLGGVQGNNTFEIVLSDTTTDTLVVNVSVEEGGGECNFTRYTINAAVYNDNTQTIEDVGSGQLIRVVRL